MVAKKTDKIRKATAEIADIIEAHLAKLTPSQREARWRAFEKVTARAGVRRAKGAGRPQTPAIRLSARGREPS